MESHSVPVLSGQTEGLTLNAAFLRLKSAIDYRHNLISKQLPMQVYQFSDGQNTYSVEAQNAFRARQKLAEKGVDPAPFVLVNIKWGEEFPTD